jgi:hypothetical protein
MRVLVARSEKPYRSRTLLLARRLAHKVIHRKCGEVGPLERCKARTKVEQRKLNHWNQLLSSVLQSLLTILSTEIVQKPARSTSAWFGKARTGHRTTGRRRRRSGIGGRRVSLIYCQSIKTRHWQQSTSNQRLTGPVGSLLTNLSTEAVHKSVALPACFFGQGKACPAACSGHWSKRPTGSARILRTWCFSFEIKGLSCVNCPCTQFYPQNLCRKANGCAALFLIAITKPLKINDLRGSHRSCAQSCPHKVCRKRGILRCLSFAHYKITD